MAKPPAYIPICIDIDDIPESTRIDVARFQEGYDLALRRCLERLLELRDGYGNEVAALSLANELATATLPPGVDKPFEVTP